MKSMITLLCATLLFSCADWMEYRERKRRQIFTRLNDELFRVVTDTNSSCEEKVAQIDTISGEFEKHVDHQNDFDAMRLAKMYCDFESLFLRGRFEYAYKEGMEALPYVGQIHYGFSLKVELLVLSLVLDRHSEFEKAVDIWKTHTKEEVLGVAKDILDEECLSSLNDPMIMQRIEDLSAPSEVLGNQKTE